MSRVFIVEDEMMVVMLLEDLLLDLGHEVVSTAQRLGAATQAAERVDTDLAILDVNLAGELSFPVAEIFERRGIPFMFASGYGRFGVEDRYPDITVVAKPFTAAQLANAITRTLS